MSDSELSNIEDRLGEEEEEEEDEELDEELDEDEDEYGYGDEEEEEEEEEEEAPLSSDDDDGNFKLEEDEDDDDDMREAETPVPQPKGKKLNLKLKLPPAPAPAPISSSSSSSKTNNKKKKQEDSDEYQEPANKRTPQAPKAKRGRKPGSAAATTTTTTQPSSSLKKRRTAAVNYNYDYNEEDYSDSEDIIVTPALDDEGLSSTDEEDENDAVPDVTKMTERQRAKLLDNGATGNVTESPEPMALGKHNSLVSLSNKINKRKELTEEENQLRKAEIARKRKNMTQKKLEEEKHDTINKLLKRRAGKANSATMKEDEDSIQLDKPRRPYLEHEALISWVSNKDGLKMRVPSYF